MNRDDFRRLADLRLKEAQTLLEAGLYDGAFYLAGYAVECALKACIASKTRQYDFPDKQLVKQIYKHDPQDLLKAAGLEGEFKDQAKNNKELERNWAAVINWSEESRYDCGKSRKVAEDLIAAIEDSRNGILPWLKRRW